TRQGAAAAQAYRRDPAPQPLPSLPAGERVREAGRLRQRRQALSARDRPVRRRTPVPPRPGPRLPASGRIPKGWRGPAPRAGARQPEHGAALPGQAGPAAPQGALDPGTPDLGGASAQLAVLAAAPVVAALRLVLAFLGFLACNAQAYTGHGLASRFG